MADRITLETINLEPTTEEYERIGCLFIASLARELSTAVDADGEPRERSALVILRELIGLVAYFATQPDGAARVARLQAFTEAQGNHCEPDGSPLGTRYTLPPD